MLKSFTENGQVLHINYVPPTVFLNYFVSCIVNVMQTQSKCYLNNCEYAVGSSSALWNFLDFFPQNIFYFQLLESTDVESMDTGQSVDCHSRCCQS